jgi:phage terminase large subunit-like protein
VTTLTTSEITAAFGLFKQLATEHKLAHRGQPDLKTALANALQREVGDGAHAWARKNTAIDISPLVAATNAVWAANKFARPVDIMKTLA